MAGEGCRQVLGDYFTLQRGTTYKSRLLDQPGPVLLGLATIQRNGGFRTDSLRTYGGESPDKLLVHPGDLYLSLKDVTQSADLLGAVARLPRDHSPGRLTQDTVKLDPKGNVPLDYLYWLLRTPQYRSYCRSHATGTTNLGLAREDFLAFPAPEPTPDQHRIVETLGTLDDKIELNRRMNETLETMARALFKSWFVDFDPVRAKAEGRNPGLPQRLADLFPDSFEGSELGEIPKGWRVGCVDDEFDLIMGQSPPGNTYNETGDGPPFYQGRTDFGFRFPARRVYCTAPTRLAKRGDSLISVRAPVGDVNIAAEDCAIGRGLAAARHRTGSRAYSFQFMRSLSQVFGRFEAEGTVFGSIGKKDFHAIACVVPPRDLVVEFERRFVSLDDRIEVADREARMLAALRDSLLPRLVSGELRGAVHQARLDPPTAAPHVAQPLHGGLAPIPTMPSVVPTMPAGREAAVLIWAIVHANGGVIRRVDLARVFALRNDPETLVRFAPSELTEVVRGWRAVVGAQRSQGTLASVLNELAARSGVDVATDEGGRSVVKLNANTPAKDEIDPWYQFEASLAVHVLQAVPITNVAAVDALVAGDDRVFLAS